jgi:hypothetical protein
MMMFEWILVLLLAAVILTNLAERLAVPYPSLLAIAGAGLAFVPFAPQIRIEPELALALFVAPAMSSARGQETHVPDRRRTSYPIAQLRHMHAQVLRNLHIGHASLLDQAHSLKLELAGKLPSLHDPPPAPSKQLTRCLRNRVQATKPYTADNHSLEY